MKFERSARSGRLKLNLRAALSRGTALALGAAITVAVALLAWWLGRDDPVPGWIAHGLVPALGWIYIALVVVALAGWWRRRAAQRRRP